MLQAERTSEPHFINRSAAFCKPKAYGYDGLGLVMGLVL